MGNLFFDEKPRVRVQHVPGGPVQLWEIYDCGSHWDGYVGILDGYENITVEQFNRMPDHCFRLAIVMRNRNPQNRVEPGQVQGVSACYLRPYTGVLNG